ncbi:MAG: hypothetical protein K2N23_07005 [Clostridia bacterium]|nr:hypothetical protein [Clostridia bacterium]
MAANKSLQNFSEAVSEALKEIAQETYAEIDVGLDKAMDYMSDKLAAASPVDSGLTRESWEGEGKYKNIRYINNTRVNENGIPVVNLLEYGKKGKPFLRKTVERETENIINIIKGEIEK